MIRRKGPGEPAEHHRPWGRRTPWLGVLAVLVLAVAACGGNNGDDDEEIDGGYYEKCYDEPGNGSWPHAERYDEVITVFLMP